MGCTRKGSLYFEPLIRFLSINVKEGLNKLFIFQVSFQSDLSFALKSNFLKRKFR